MSKPPPTTHSLGARLLPALAMTAAASGLIALLDRPASGSAGAVIGNSAALPDPGASPGSTQPPLVSSTTPAVVQGEDDGGGAAPPVQVPAAPVPVQPTTPAAKPASTGPCTGKTKDGPSVQTRWGPVQVEAVISSSGQICDVTAIRSPNSHGRSVRINQQALPILHTQVMKAQGTRIYGVSGATITSEGYVESLQAILDGSAG
jgi:uncharacterized protein with FMN-binding domain